LKQPLDDHVFPIKTSAVEGSLAISISSLAHFLRKLEQQLKSLNIPISSSSDEGSIPVKIADIDLWLFYQ
jgi:hypothetical protein